MTADRRDANLSGADTGDAGRHDADPAPAAGDSAQAVLYRRMLARRHRLVAPVSSGDAIADATAAVASAANDPAAVAPPTPAGTAVDTPLAVTGRTNPPIVDTASGDGAAADPDVFPRSATMRLLRDHPKLGLAIGAPLLLLALRTQTLPRLARHAMTPAGLAQLRQLVALLAALDLVRRRPR